MKALIKSGLCLAFGWLASSAGAQELPIKWQAATPRNASSIAVVTAPASKSDTGLRAVTLSQPIPLETSAAGGISAFAPIIRGQAPDEKNVQPVPKLETGGTAQKPPQKMPKDAFTGPTPQPVPSPIFGNLGMMPSESTDDCGLSSSYGPAEFGRDGCQDRRRFWVGAEYLMWWQRGQNVPPLVTSSPLGIPPVLGAPTTNILYDGIPNPMRSGGRFSAGMWLPHFCCNLGIEGNFFFLNRQSSSSTFNSDGTQQFARPFFDANGFQNAEVFGNNSTVGSAVINTFSQLYGFEGNMRYKWRCGPNYWFDLIGGYRHLNLSEGIDISETAQTFVRPGLAGVRFLEQESFRTRNQFNGTQIGIDGEVRFWSRMFLGMNAKVALGSVHQIINIDGTTTFSNVPAPIGNSVQQGALLTSPTNIGRYTANRFGVLPEAALKIGFDVTDNLRLFVGYDFMYLSSVVRPGDQIDLRVNQNFTPSIFGPGVGGGPRVPAVLYKTSDYWAQGLNFGLQYRY